ncbi:hypothetical protein [uncultured Martelella sp.]|uniref:hypothetical protein n=1 Tax=uncultured Martelella sp. TaxID=392331 RepID=UPI0029C86A6A|nr:hypothetical protein [uncultured Martelella sp.]
MYLFRGSEVAEALADCEVRVFRTSLFLLIAFAGMYSSETRAGGKNVETWRELWTRCRLAVEQSESLNVQGLHDLGQSTRRIPPLIVKGYAYPLIPGYEIFLHKWQQPGSSFVVVVEEYPGSRLSCAVQLASAASAITPNEEALFASAFLQERQTLVAAGTHEEKELDPIFSTNLGMGPIGRNENGCSVVSGLQIETGAGLDSFFSSFSAERSGCLMK